MSLFFPFIYITPHIETGIKWTNNEDYFGLFCLDTEVVIDLSVLWTDNLNIFVVVLADSFRVHLDSLYPLIDVLCNCVASGAYFKFCGRDKDFDGIYY